MKRTLLITALLLTQLSGQDFIAKDKTQHAVAGLFIYGGCVVIGEILKKQDVTDNVNSKTCVLAPMIIGGAKEWYDYRHPDTHVAEFSDFTATAFPALVINYTLEF